MVERLILCEKPMEEYEQMVAKVQSATVILDKRYENGKLVDVDDNAIRIYYMENGAIGTITASWT